MGFIHSSFNASLPGQVVLGELFVLNFVEAPMPFDWIDRQYGTPSPLELLSPDPPR
jgi:hypothetical protein